MSKIIDQVIAEEYAAYCGDSIELIKEIPDNSIHYSIFSPPFANLFTYSNFDRDMGNAKDDDEFYSHFEYLVPELFRVIMPGRLVSIHCMNLLSTKTEHGYIGLRDFRGELIRLFVKNGWIFHSEVCIWKDPLIQAVRTKALGLAHKQIIKDSTMCNQGLPDYLITMRKPGVNPEPVSRKRGFEKYIGERKEPKAIKRDDPAKNKYSHAVFQRYASPVWFDISQTNTLNKTRAREGNDEKHICPLQLDVIARALEYWTNEGDIVLSPFAGIGSEGYQSLLDHRKFIGFELKRAYFKEMIRNLKKALRRRNRMKLINNLKGGK